MKPEDALYARLTVSGITLDEDEEIEFMTAGWFPWWFYVFVVTLVLWLPAKSRSLIVTNKRVLMTNGLIRREQRIAAAYTKELVRQQFIERVLA